MSYVSLLKNPVTFKVLDISTAHITKSDGQKLGKARKRKLKGADVPIVYDYEEGAFVYCGYEEKTFHPDFSNEFNAILEFARQKGYRYVCFDCDATEYDDLPKFEW